MQDMHQESHQRLTFALVVDGVDDGLGGDDGPVLGAELVQVLVSSVGSQPSDVQVRLTQALRPLVAVGVAALQPTSKRRYTRWYMAVDDTLEG